MPPRRPIDRRVLGLLLAGAAVLSAAWAVGDGGDEARRPGPGPGPGPGGDVETLDAARGGQDRVGRPMPDLAFDALLPAPGTTPEESRADAAAEPAVTVYRWWTDTCPACERSLPALDSLRARYARDGLRTVAVYHPKPARTVAPAHARELATERGYRGEIALDLDWSELDRAYLAHARRAATSVTFVVDARGVVRFVHPGPVFHPSEDPREARENADFDALERAIRVLLGVADDADGADDMHDTHDADDVQRDDDAPR